MTEAEEAGIYRWLLDGGLAGWSETELLGGFCERCRSAGLELSRAMVAVDTLHPIYEGRAFRWRGDGVREEPVIEYGRTNQGGANEDDWKTSPFYWLLTSGEAELRRELHLQEPEFPLLRTLRDEGETDYLALLQRFGSDASFGEMDCIFSRWTTRRDGGFTSNNLDALRRLVPALALAVKCASLARITTTLVEVYLGRDPGRRVLQGRIARGATDRIGAVLWFSDLRDYTGISDRVAPEEIIPFLNDYAEEVISAVYGAGGDVLKLIGDGVLAMFQSADPAEACGQALQAEADLRSRLAALEARRRAAGQPATSVYLGLHVGDVLYGNIGSDERLDFTVVGPAVNEVSRITSMCRSVDRSILMSEAFCAALPAVDREKIVSVGRFALRGVGRAQELFTLDPACTAAERPGPAGIKELQDIEDKRL